MKHATSKEGPSTRRFAFPREPLSEGLLRPHNPQLGQSGGAVFSGRISLDGGRPQWRGRLTTAKAAALAQWCRVSRAAGTQCTVPWQHRLPATRQPQLTSQPLQTGVLLLSHGRKSEQTRPQNPNLCNCAAHRHLSFHQSIELLPHFCTSHPVHKRHTVCVTIDFLKSCNLSFPLAHRGLVVRS